VSELYSKEEADIVIKAAKETPTRKPGMNKPILDWKDYQEYRDAVRKLFDEQFYEYSDEEKKELAKRQPHCPESLKWDRSRPYTGNERVCVELPDPKNVYGHKTIITTVDKAMGLDQKTECRLPQKPGGRNDYGPGILRDEKGVYIMATPDECYAKQMARFAEVSRDDWYHEGEFTLSSWWNKFGLKAYDDLTQKFGKMVSDGIQSEVKGAISNAIKPYFANEAYDKKQEAEARKARQTQLDKDLKDVFSKKFGISPEKQDQFWADYFKVVQKGGNMEEFFNNFGSTYSTDVFRKLAADAENTLNRRTDRQADWRNPFSPNYDETRVREEENAVRNTVERDVANNLPPLPRPRSQTEADQDNIDDSATPPPPDLPPLPRPRSQTEADQDNIDNSATPPPPEDLFGNGRRGKKAIRGGVGEHDFNFDDFSGLSPFSGKMDGLLPERGQFWRDPAAFVHNINEKLGLTGETETETYAKQNPEAPPQVEPIKIRGEPEKQAFNINRPQKWNDRAEELLKRRRYMLDWYPSKATLGYEPNGSQFKPAEGLPYHPVSGGKSTAKTAFVRYLESEAVVPAKYLKEAKAKAKKAGLDWKSLTWATDGKHKLEIVHEGRPVRFGASGMGDHIFYKQAGDPTADSHRKAYRARATKIKGNWASNKYSPNSLAIAVLW
jgi:hypothetical protein